LYSLSIVKIEVFSYQLKIAKEHNLPVIVHSRGAWEQCFELVSDYASAVSTWNGWKSDAVALNNNWVASDPLQVSATGGDDI
jgi:Tat protein secretion system quality control protein TatD with DNase activity